MAIVVAASAVKRAPEPVMSPGRKPFTATTRLTSDITGASGSVEASGGGTMPYSKSPGRTRSYQTRESRSRAALFAACRYFGVPPIAVICCAASSKRRRCVSNSVESGTSAVAKCV